MRIAIGDRLQQPRLLALICPPGIFVRIMKKPESFGFCR
jgi:hypothetical protein